MAREHPAQLRVCHERIRANHKPDAHAAKLQAYCSLGAYAWCFDCSHYVCDIHANSRHEGHDTYVEFPANGPRPGSTTFRR